MKVLQVAHRYPPSIGGVERHVEQISRELVKLGHDVTVFSADAGQSHSSDDGVTIRRFSAIAPNDAYFWSPSLAREVRRVRDGFDIIHAHNYHALPALSAFVSRGATPFVFTGHFHAVGHSGIRNLLHHPYRMFARALFEKSNAVIAVSQAEAQLVARQFRVRSVDVIPNGIDIDSLENAPPESFTRKTLLIAGRLEKYKNVEIAVDALAEAPEWNLLIVGSGDDRERLRKVVAEHGFQDRVTFAGNLPQQKLNSALRGAHAACSLSSHEAFGIATLEAIAACAPIAVSNIPAHAELFSKFPDRIHLLPEVTPRTLADWLNGVPDRPAIPPKTLSEFSWPTIAQLTAGVYQRASQ